MPETLTTTCKKCGQEKPATRSYFCRTSAAGSSEDAIRALCLDCELQSRRIARNKHKRLIKALDKPLKTIREEFRESPSAMSTRDIIPSKINSIEDLKTWRMGSRPGERATYYLGNLAEDRVDKRLAIEIRKGLDALADAVNDLWYLGEAHLFQRRLARGFDYIIEKAKPPYQPRKHESVKPLSHPVRHKTLILEDGGKVLSLHDFRNLNPHLVKNVVKVMPDLTPTPQEDLARGTTTGMEADGHNKGPNLEIGAGPPGRKVFHNGGDPVSMSALACAEEFLSDPDFELFSQIVHQN